MVSFRVRDTSVMVSHTRRSLNVEIDPIKKWFLVPKRMLIYYHIYIQQIIQSKLIVSSHRGNFHWLKYKGPTISGNKKFKGHIRDKN